MKLFFETSAQAHLFLLMLPTGFLLAFLIDLSGKTGTVRTLMDVLVLLLGSAMIGSSIVLLGDGGLRLYHLLAVTAGALLYMLGIRSLIKAMCKRYMLWQKKRCVSMQEKPVHESKYIRTD